MQVFDVAALPSAFEPSASVVASSPVGTSVPAFVLETLPSFVFVH